jgi:hypothetical protein
VNDDDALLGATNRRNTGVLAFAVSFLAMSIDLFYGTV